MKYIKMTERWNVKQAANSAYAQIKRFVTFKRTQEVDESKFLEAVDQNNVAEIIRCTEAGVNPNCRDVSDGSTALHKVAERGDLPLAVYLLGNLKINLEQTSYLGQTPLHLACVNQKVKMVKCLLKNKANPNARDRFDRTCLHVAARYDSIILALILVKYGADVNVIDALYNTPLHFATLVKWFFPMVKFLLRHGANPNLDTGNMPLFLECVFTCYQKHEMEITLHLLGYNVNVNVTDKIAKRNALHFVAITGYEDLARGLLRHGCNVYAKDFFGYEPLDIANAHDNFDVIMLFEYFIYGSSISLSSD